MLDQLDILGTTGEAEEGRVMDVVYLDSYFEGDKEYFLLW